MAAWEHDAAEGGREVKFALAVVVSKGSSALILETEHQAIAFDISRRGSAKWSESLGALVAWMDFRELLRALKESEKKPTEKGASATERGAGI